MGIVERLADLPDNPQPPGTRLVRFAAADGVALRGAVFPALGTRSRGTVLLLHGRAEFIERFFETIRDFQVRGFTVATFDWRGQGGSQRLLKNPAKGHARGFHPYDLDLEAALEHLMAGLPQPWWLVAHSTGGLVAIANAARLAGRIRRVVLIAPFLGLGNFHVPERLARGLAKGLHGLGLGRAWIPGGNATPIHALPTALERLTSDPVRHARNAALSKANTDLAIGAPTIGWLAGAFRAIDRVFRPEALEAYALPTLVFACGADPVVSNAAIENFVVRTRSTDLLVIAGARHELLQERDRYREQFWAAFDAYIPGSIDVPQPEPETPITVPAEPPAPSGAEGEQPQDLVVQPGIAGGDDTATVGGATAGPGGDDATGSLDHRDQGDDVVGLQGGLDHHVDEPAGDHAIGIAVDPVTRQTHP